MKNPGAPSSSSSTSSPPSGTALAGLLPPPPPVSRDFAPVLSAAPTTLPSGTLAKGRFVAGVAASSNGAAASAFSGPPGSWRTATGTCKVQAVDDGCCCTAVGGGSRHAASLPAAPRRCCGGGRPRRSAAHGGGEGRGGRRCSRDAPPGGKPSLACAASVAASCGGANPGSGTGCNAFIGDSTSTGALGAVHAARSWRRCQ
mmetsp:Transcript_50795/g.140910  ORF Transcript_50795/g.140910 Transcript_50795/m.140910 type:complete len:201 (-) Transcript_50795:130-732(-)